MTDLREPASAFDLQHKYTAETGTVLLTGVQALVRVVLDQMRTDRRRGLRTASFVSGYPGSPFGGLDQEFAAAVEHRERYAVVHQPGHNEDLAATSVAGSQVVPTLPSARYEGVLGVWYGKAPGLDRSLDAIRHAQYVGTSALGGALAYVGDDPASKSSSAPSGSELTLRSLAMPILEPGSIQEIIELGLHGVALSRRSGLWAALRVTTPVADSIGTAEVRPEQSEVVLPTLEWRGAPYVPHISPNITGQFGIDAEVEVLDIRTRLAREYGTVNGLNRIEVSSSDDWIGIASRGHTWYELRAALGVLGLDDDALRRLGIRLLHVLMPDPIDPGVLRTFGAGLEEIVVVEEKRSFLESSLREALYGVVDPPVIVGKTDERGETLFPTYGTLDSDRIAAALVLRLIRRIDASRIAVPPPRRRTIPVAAANRAAYLCSGCPHNSSLRVPEGVLLGAGIGCHALGGRMDPAMFGVTTFKTHMGGEGAAWIGIEPFVGDDHMIQNVGDGTFFHSGQLAVQAAIAAGSHVTFKLLWNGAIAMTGGQSTSVSNAIPVPDLVEVLLRQGVARVLITTDDLDRYRAIRLARGVDVWDRTRVVEAQVALRAVPGVTVLIHDQECANEKRRARKRGRIPEASRRIAINERVCEGCGDCGVKSNCLSVEPVDTEFGRKTRINQSSCNNDESCLRGECPSFVSVVPSRKKRSRNAGHEVAVDDRALEVPTLIVPADEVIVRMPGIGGTGVVTVNQLLGTAARLDGREVWGLDQTGLSQKAGPVVSDLRIANTALGGSNRPVNGSVDLYLVFDLIVGVAPSNLDGIDPTRTVAVVSSSRTPTGDMVSHVDVRYPDLDAMETVIRPLVRDGGMWSFDALGACRALFGDTATANVFLVGAAFQIGALPLTAAAIERALELNGVAVERNVQAFRWGRVAVADPDRLTAVMRTAGDGSTRLAGVDDAAVTALVERIAPGTNATLHEMLRTRIADLIAYQDRRYAERYATLVAEVRAAEDHAAEDHAGESDLALTHAVAIGLHHLMAYKDEYEVARLHLDPVARRAITDEFGEDAKLSWHLQPPVLGRWLGDRKLVLGSWFTPALRVLRASRRLRGTALDPFGRAEVRRLERALAVEYESVIRSILGRLDASNIGVAIELARLAEQVRGYESVKLANVERYRRALRQKAAELGVSAG